MGEETATAVTMIELFDPDASWSKVEAADAAAT
jgi:hypothetical protein